MIYEPNGIITVYGCAIKYFRKNFLVYFAVGERAFIKNKAERKGVLESIIIKKVTRNTNQRHSYSGFVAEVVYVDTMNRVWLERELSELFLISSSHVPLACEPFSGFSEARA